MKSLLCFLALLSLSTFAHNLKLASYIQMQEALAKDDFKTALSAHGVICDKELLHYKTDYKECPKTFKTIEELRTAFKLLSALYMKHGEKSDLKDLVIAECPMASAKWIQKKGDLRNPYYGKSMLECGSVVETKK